MDGTSTVVICGLGEIPRVTAALGDAMRACSYPEEAVLDLQLAVEEAVANTLLHGYGGAPGEVRVTIRAARRATEVRIEDRAPPFDPLSFPEPDRDSDLGERRIGGLGIYLVRRLTDDATHRRSEGWNVLTLVKRRPS
ncbi:MAG: ATP-binding protein [Methanospirillum sp.]|nr:ATP-binding protein [Methanospirillum sp.]